MNKKIESKPFLKWAGGKHKLVPIISDKLNVEYWDGVTILQDGSKIKIIPNEDKSSVVALTQSGRKLYSKHLIT